MRAGLPRIKAHARFGPCDTANSDTYTGTELTNAASFEWRDGAKLHWFNGKYWILGGWWDHPIHVEWNNAITTNQVWSSPDLITWTQRLAHDDNPPTSGAGARWRRRHNYGSCVKDGLLWVIGGDHLDTPTFNQPPSDIWTSPDGVTWTRIASSSPWGPKRLPIVGVYKGRIHVCGGEDTGTDFPSSNEHWSSADGINWTRHPNMPFRRCGVTQLATMCDKMFICGGDAGTSVTRTFERDVWAWDGNSWVCQTSHAPWHGRLWNGVVAYDGKLWVCAGRIRDGVDVSDLWYSSDLGVTWTEHAAPWQQTHADGVDATEAGGIVMASGFGSGQRTCRVIKP